MDRVTELRKWFHSLPGDEQRSVLQFLYGNSLITEGLYCGPPPGIVKLGGLYCGPAPASVAARVCSGCGRSM